MPPAPVVADKKVEKSYLSSAVGSINPWGGSRSTTPTPRDPPASDPPPPTNPGDHSISTVYGQSFKRYPAGCPPLKVQWFHAVDVPKRKPEWLKGKKAPKDVKPSPPAKKYTPFSTEDNRSLETAYQKLLEDLEEERSTSSVPGYQAGSKRKRTLGAQDIPNTNFDLEEDDAARVGVKVPVNEDYLFDVDIEERELAPVYWLGPVYEVRRGSWFYQEGSVLRPCEENLAAQLEEGYLKIRPWSYPARVRSNSQTRDITPKASSENLKNVATAQGDFVAKAPTPTQHQPQTHRLFGTYMSQSATYQDASTAWLSNDGMLSWVTSTMYERFAGGGYMSGVKLVRGYSAEPLKAKEEKRPSTPTGTKSTPEADDKQQRALKRRSAPPSTGSNANDESPETKEDVIESRGARITRQLSSLMESAENRDPEQEEEIIRKREEQEIQDDYNARVGETQGREIEHVVLVTHGIGQLLGIRMESVNFVHDVNVMRKTLKSVYSTSADLRALNSEAGDGLGNCRIQVLPVCWRHLLDFPRRKTDKKHDHEHDLAEAPREEDEYPSLEDITIEGMAFARSLISDLALDVLLYQSAYREQIATIVLQESNRIYKLFMERNPGFKGKIHIMGHSLGSAIMFDILCRQKEQVKRSAQARNPLRFWPSQERVDTVKDTRELIFNFDVDDFYCLGSPVGLFQMLKGRTIAARHLPNALPSESPLNPEYMDDPFLYAPLGSPDQRVSPITGLPFSISSPKVAQLFNIFHPSDPISYRLEPLISPAMSSLKPQTLPYTKKGIFGSVAPQGLTGIGAKVGQSVSGFWSSVSAGIASNLLNRSLGLTQEDVANFSASSTQNVASLDAESTIPVAGATEALVEKINARKRQLAVSANSFDGRTSTSGNDVTLIDDELETLYSKFQQKRVSLAEGNTDVREDWAEEEAKARRLAREEVKVRALNRNGRVDYSIQESVLDFNPINTIASHMSYWADEDVSHFIMSQLLSNKERSEKK